MLRYTKKQQDIIKLYLKGRDPTEIAYKLKSSEVYVKRVIKNYNKQKWHSNFIAPSPTISQ